MPSTMGMGVLSYSSQRVQPILRLTLVHVGGNVWQWWFCRSIGRQFTIYCTTDTSAPQGKIGTLLLNPKDILIQVGGLLAVNKLADRYY